MNLGKKKFGKEIGEKKKIAALRRGILFTLAAVAILALGWAARVVATPAEPPLSKFAPSGALLYLQAADFSSLLEQWNSSSEKKQWLAGSNYEAFSRSRLFLRLKGASDQFAAAAGLPPDMNFLTQVAGKQSAVALYDIGNLQFLYITRLPSASSMQTGLWQTRPKFETREAGGVTFYVRRDPESERVVAFAATGDYLLLATREDLLAGALQLIAGSKDRTIESDPWWTQSVAAAGTTGNLRLVLNLEKIVPSPYFRTYWVQQNITDMKQYSSAVSDMFLSRGEYREERVLLRKNGQAAQASDGAQAVAELARIVPEDAGFYEVKADPSADECFDLVATKILAPHLGAAPPSQIAPQVQLGSGETGASTDLETRIDQAPAQNASTDRSAGVKTLFANNRVLGTMRVQSTERKTDGVFVRLHSAIAMQGSVEWNETEVRNTLTDFVRSGLTASQLGLGWQQKSGYAELDGLWPLSVAVHGKLLLIGDDPSLLSNMLARTSQKTDVEPAVLISGFRHPRERDNFGRLTAAVDRPNTQGGGEREPQFFSENIASLSSALAGVSAETLAVHDVGDKVLETVTYEWSQ